MATKPSVKRNKSAEKRVRQADKRRVRNAHVKSTVKTAMKKADASLLEGNKADATEKVNLAVRTLARAASKGVLHRNTAARRISRLTRKLNKTAASPA